MQVREMIQPFDVLLCLMQAGLLSLIEQQLRESLTKLTRTRYGTADTYVTYKMDV